MNKRPTFIREYFRLGTGLIVFVTGCLLVSSTIKADSYGLWFPVITILLGAFMTSVGGIGAIFGILMLLTGGSQLLHHAGLVTIPYISMIIGWIFVALGGLLITVISMKIVKKWKSGDPGDSGVDDLDNVDY